MRLHMNGDEFLRRLDAGEWDERYDKPGYLHIGFLESLRPYGEQES